MNKSFIFRHNLRAHAVSTKEPEYLNVILKGFAKSPCEKLPKSHNSKPYSQRYKYRAITMNMQQIIEEKLNKALAPEFLDVINESHMHSGPATESHFKVIAVSDVFNGKMLIARHRMINAALADELQQIHALALHTMTPDEYFEKSGKVADSPACEGGSKP